MRIVRSLLLNPKPSDKILFTKYSKKVKTLRGKMKNYVYYKGKRKAYKNLGTLEIKERQREMSWKYEISRQREASDWIGRVTRWCKKREKTR